ncbi:MAG: hypothetical protein Q7J05_06505 [Paludibacter sp.]|nr:hypothetical protein [Paludibacter sp.]
MNRYGWREGNVPGRIVISSTQDRDEETWTANAFNNHWGFFKNSYNDNGFAFSMGSFLEPKSVGYAFDKGYYAANHNGIMGWTNYHPGMQDYGCDAYTMYW